MKVSVCITAYNHDKYIAQAIEGALMQKTDFDFEIIIGEDDSKDGTRETVKKYKEQYPDRITLFLNDRKNVIYINGRPTGRWNFMNNIKNARGDYIALLDGDDYWTSPDKLQRQADFLDANPDCSMCFHDVKKLYEDSVPPKFVVFSPKVKKERYVLEDLLRGNLMSTCSVMFRRGLFGEFPDWFCNTAMADWPLHILNAEHGDIGRIDKVMGVYRVHSGGVWFQTRPLYQFKNAIAVYKLLGGHFAGKHKKAIMKSVLYRFVQLFISCFHESEARMGLALRRSKLKAVAELYRRIFYPESAKK